MLEPTLFPQAARTDALPRTPQAAPEGGGWEPPPRVQVPDRRQRFWEDTCLDERLPADHPARTIWQVVQTLDLAALYAPLRARGSEPGRAAIDPQLLLALWLYAACEGVGNGRKLARLCEQHDAYRWLCGGVSVNYHTLNDFRVQHEAALDGLLTQVLTALVARGVVKVERISQDGKRVRASAGSSSFHRGDTLRRMLEQTRAYVEELKRQPDEAPAEAARQRAAQAAAAREQQGRLEEALALLPALEAARQNPRNNRKDRAKPVRVSSTDPEARKMKMPDGGVRPAYNLQLAVDVQSGAVVGVEVGTSGDDGKYSGALREQVEGRTGQQVREHLADEGYVDMKEIDRAESAGVAMYVPLPKSPKTGQPVTASRWDTAGTERWRARMQTPAAEAVYRQRFPASERVNAELQERFGLRSFAVRGVRKVRCVALWTVLAFNLVHFTEELLMAASAA
jgi:transposase